jgi:hypothetical protein
MCFTIMSIWFSEIESKSMMVLNPSAWIAVTVVALKPMRVSASLNVAALAAAAAADIAAAILQFVVVANLR